MTTTVRRHKNPYVGPQSFRQGDALYGRDQEVGDLLDLLIAERVVLLHSPSGAGKTSLIQARLLELLENEGFEVLPVIRLTHEVPHALVDHDPPVNRYVLSALLSLEEGVPADRQRSLQELADISLAQYLAEWPDLDNRPGNEVLIFDQFEEVITADPVDHEAKTAFFADLGATLRDRSLWALFSMREDFVAELAPYARYIPTRFSTRFRLDLLTVEQALEAVVQPARDAGVEFEEEAAVKLVDDLRRVRTQRGTGIVEELGRHVEPVQLQVSCRQIWQGIGDARRIGIDDIEALGDVNEALAAYYAASVAAVARQTGVSERSLRDWFERELVTAQGFRGQVLEGPDSAGEAGGRVLELLTDAHLLRAESRRGAVWYELAHDRLTQPIEQDNARWREKHLSDIERRASDWDRQGRPDHLLLVGPELDRAQGWAAQPDSAPTRVERDFLAASVKAQRQRDDLLSAAVRTRRWLRFAVGLLVLVIIVCGFAVWMAVSAAHERTRAQESESRANRVGLLSAGVAEISSDNQLGILLTLRALASEKPGRSPSSWDAANALQRALNSSPVVQRLGDPASKDVAAAWSKDGDRAATADKDGTLRLVDTTSGKVLAEHSGVSDVEAVAVSPTDDNLVAVARSTGSVLLWNAASDTDPLEVSSNPSGVHDVAFSPDGRRLAAAGADGSVAVSQGTTPVAKRVLGTDINAVAWSGDSTRVYAVDATGHLYDWNPRTNDVQKEKRHSAAATSVDISSNGSMIATGGLDGRTVITRVDGRGKGVVAKPPYAGAQVKAVSFTSDGAHVLTLDPVGNVDVLDSATGASAGTKNSAGQDPIVLQASPTDPGRALVATGSSAAAVWDTDPGHGSDFLVAVDSDRAGRVITAAYQADTVLTWSPDGQKVVGRREFKDARIWDAAVDPEGRYLVYTSTGGAAHIAPLGTGRRDIPLPGVVSAVAVSSSGRLVATGGTDSDVHVYDSDTGKQVAVLPDHTTTIKSLDFGANDNQLVSVDEDGNAIIWDVGKTQALRTIRADGDSVTAAEWSATGDKIAFGRHSGDIQLLGSDAQGKLLPLEWHDKPVNDLAFDTSGEHLASVGDDGYAVIWDARTGDPIRAIKDYSSWVYRTTFSEDGKHLLLSSNIGKPTTVWLDPAELRRVAESRVTTELSTNECRRYLAGKQC